MHAGQIQFFTHNWAQITQDPWVLQTIKGLRHPFTAIPVQEVALAEMCFPTEQEELISAEVQTLVRKGTICLLKDHQVGFVSQLFLVPKKDGGFHPVVNLKALNKYNLEEHFKMEGFHMVRDLVRQGDWLAKIDLKDAYFLIPVHPCHQKFLQFTWKESLYQFQCLPFGLSCAPRVFTKVMKPVVAFLRERGIKLIIYLDDLLIIYSCPEILSGFVPDTRSDHQQDQISDDAYPGDCVLRFSSFISKNDHFSPSGKDEENQAGCSSSIAEAPSANTGNGHLCGKDHGSQSSYQGGSSIPSPASSTDKQCNITGTVESRSANRPIIGR